MTDQTYRLYAGSAACPNCGWLAPEHSRQCGWRPRPDAGRVPPPPAPNDAARPHSGVDCPE